MENSKNWEEPPFLGRGPGRGATELATEEPHMDITPYLELKIGPPRRVRHARRAPTARRFMLPTAAGDWEAVTWGAYADAIRKLASSWPSSGLDVGDRAAIFAPNSRGVDRARRWRFKRRAA